MTERWRKIEDFYDYEISDAGAIFSKKSMSRLSFSENSSGQLKVNLMRNGVVYTRSVRVLVAEAFLHRPTHIDPLDGAWGVINKDGNPWNNEASNLAWRPKWFCWKYFRQFRLSPVRYEDYNRRVINETTGQKYENVLAAGIDEGVLWDSIYDSCISGKAVYPTGHTYSF